MSLVNLAWFVWGAVFGLYVVAGMIWALRLRVLNPKAPLAGILLLAVCWPYCELKADRHPTHPERR